MFPSERAPRKKAGNQNFTPNRTSYRSYLPGYQTLTRIPPLQPGDTVRVHPDPDYPETTKDDPLNGKVMKILTLHARITQRYKRAEWTVVLDNGRNICWKRCERISVSSSEDGVENV